MNEMSKIINRFFQLNVQAKLFHWNTIPHKGIQVAEDIQSAILNLTDVFMKEYIAIYGRRMIKEPYNTIKLTIMTERCMVLYLKKSKEFVENELLKYIDEEKDLVLLKTSKDLSIVLTAALCCLTNE